jgi:hypothetical protein
MANELHDLLGKIYVTHVLNRGDRAKSEATFKEALKDPDFRAQAQAKLDMLNTQQGDEVCGRDFIQRTYRGFLRQHLAGG